MQEIVFSDDGDEAPLPDPSEKFEELLTRLVAECNIRLLMYLYIHSSSFICSVRSKEFKKRAMQRITFSLGPDLELGVGV